MPAEHMPPAPARDALWQGLHALHARYPAVTAAPGRGASAGVLLLPLRCAAPQPGSLFGALLVHCARQDKLAALVCAFIERRAVGGAVRAGLDGDVLEFDGAAATLDGPVGTALEAALEALSMRRCDRLLLADDGVGARFVEERPVSPPAHTGWAICAWSAGSAGQCGAPACPSSTAR